MYSKIENLNQSLNNLSNQFWTLESSIGQIDYSVNRQLKEFNQENSWIRSTNLEPIQYNDTDQSATIEIEIEFNTLQSEEKSFILIQTKEGKTFDKIDVSSLNDNLTLKYIVELPIDDYIFTIIGETTFEQRSNSIGELNLKERLSHLYSLEGSHNRSEFDKDENYVETSFDFFLFTGHEKEGFFSDYFEKLEITEILLKIVVDDELFDTIDISDSENWTSLDSGSKLDNTEQEVVVYEIKDSYFNYRDLDFHSTYTFTETVNAKQKIQYFIEIHDNQGNTYLNELY
jgi:hypothetical protein